MRGSYLDSRPMPGWAARTGSSRSSTATWGSDPVRFRKPCLRASIEVLENLIRTGPLVGRYDEVDVAAPTPIQLMIGNTRRVDPERSQLVAPRHRGALIVEGADGLPRLKARIVDRHRRVLGRTSKSLRESHRHEPTPRRRAGRLLLAQRESLSSVTQASAHRPSERERGPRSDARSSAKGGVTTTPVRHVQVGGGVLSTRSASVGGSAPSRCVTGEATARFDWLSQVRRRTRSRP
jgi:hypothetical protein